MRQKLDATHAGHLDVGDQAACLARAIRGKEINAAGKGAGTVAGGAQQAVERIAQGLVVVDNGMYGTIRMHQEREYPGRVSGTRLQNPDFAAFARAYGGHGETVEATDQFAPAFERARASGLPAIIHIKLDPEALTPTRTRSEIRAAGKGK